MNAKWTKTGHLIAHSASLEYACFGPSPADAPTLVLLHEGLGSAQLWRDFPSQLVESTGCGVFAYSRAGYGQSDSAILPRPLDYMTREAVDSLPHVLDAIGISQGVLVGHSDGATIAAIHAGKVVDPRIVGVVLMAPHFFAESMSLTAIANAKVAYEQDGLKPRLAKYHRDPDNAFFGWNDSWLHPEFTLWNVASVLESIRVPVLAIQGLQDQYGTLAQIDAIEARCPTPVSKLLLDNCRHSPFLDCPSEVLASIAEFCKNLTLPPHANDTSSPKGFASTLFRPAYAYIPGINDRHPEDTFEHVCSTAKPNASIDELSNCDAFKHGLLYLDEGFFWEAHEVFESVWMALPIESEERRFVQGLIQFANASLKEKMMRPKAVQRLCIMAKELLTHRSDSPVMNLDRNVYLLHIDALEKRNLLTL